MPPKGKGFYIWKISACEQGNAAKIAYEAHRAGLSHVLIKIANGIYDYNYDSVAKKDLVAPLGEELSKYGISTWGWHYVFGDLPKDEAAAAIRQIRKTHLEGYVIDAESEYKGKYTPCRIFMNELRNALPDFPIALSSFRYPKLHSDLPWTDFLSKSNLNMPQVYWEQAHNPGEQLARSYSEFQSINPIRPIVPTGAAYSAGGWSPTSVDVIEFLNKALTLGVSGANFWSWDYCRNKLPMLWDTISSFDWPSAPNPEKDIIEEFVDGINTKSITKILSLYQSDAIHVTAKRTIQGLTALREWYTHEFSGSLKESQISIVDFELSDTHRKFTWKISSTEIPYKIGIDSFGLSGGKIIYHYSTMEND